MSTDVQVDTLGFLARHGKYPKRVGGENANFTCWFCDEDPAKPGRLYVNIADDDRNGLHNCFAAEVEVVTASGTRSIGDLAGTTATLLSRSVSGNPVWTQAPVEYFGEQEIWEVDLTRNGVKRTIRCTAGHRWFVRDRAGDVLTSELRPGHRLLSNAARPYGKYQDASVSPHGFVRGFIRGDGTVSYRGSAVAIDESKWDVLPYFEGSIKSLHEGVTILDEVEFPYRRRYAAGFPRFYKAEYPALNEDRSYLYGWLAGYFAADGCVSREGNCTISSARREDLEYVRDLCHVLGIRPQHIKRQDRIGLDGKSSALYQINIVGSDLDEHFFAREVHRSNWLAGWAGRPDKHVRMKWIVRDVRRTGVVEPVYCAVVPEHHNFTLDGNILTGNCFRCGHTGNAVTMWRHFGEELKESSDSSKPTSTIPLMQAACAFYESEMTDEVFSYLTGPERSLSEESIKRFRLGWAPGGHALYKHLVEEGFDREHIKASGLVVKRGEQYEDFFQRQVIIPYLSHGTAITLRGKEIGGKYRSLPRAGNRLFNAESAHNVDDVIVAEGEFDCILLEQLGFHAVGVPGAQTFEQGWENLFETARRVWLMYDPDSAGIKGAERVKKRLPRAELLSLPIPVGVLDPSKVDPSYLVGAHGWTAEHFTQLLSEARRANSLLVSPVDAFREWEHLQDAGGLKVGWPIFDAAIKPGLLPGQVVIPLAKTNSGKSIMLLNAMQSMSMIHDDVAVLFLSLEQTRAEWFERARRIWNFHNLECEAEDVNQETLNYWEPRLRIVDRNRLSAEQTTDVIREFKREVAGNRPVFVCLDYLGYFARSFDGSQYEKTTNAVMFVKEIAKEERVVIMAPHQVSRGAEHGAEFSLDVARDSGAVEETADFSMAVWNPDTLQGNDHSQRTGRLQMKLQKSRHGGKGRDFDFQFGYLSLVMVPKENVVEAGMARSEAVWDDANVPWQDAIIAHRTGIAPKGFSRIPTGGVAL